MGKQEDTALGGPNMQKKYEDPGTVRSFCCTYLNSQALMTHMSGQAWPIVREDTLTKTIDRRMN